MRVLDYSVGRPSPQDIVNVRDATGQQVYIGVLRYVAPSIDAPKIIYQPEYDALRAAGLQVGLNWEWYAERPKEGATAGASDATSALQQADALGYQGAIYFSVDYDAAPADQPGINAYFQACAEVIGLQRLGAYAGYWPLKRLFDAGLITYGWQTVAWSGGNREPRAHLYQDTFGLFAGDADGNEVLQDNWLGGSMVPKSVYWLTFGQGPLVDKGLADVALDLDLSVAALKSIPENVTLVPYDNQAASVAGMKIALPGYPQPASTPPPPPPDPAPELTQAVANLNTLVDKVTAWMKTAPTF